MNGENILADNTTECKTNPEQLEALHSTKNNSDVFGKKLTVNSSLSPLLSSEFIKFPIEFSKFSFNIKEKKSKANPQTPARQKCKIYI